MPSEAQSIEEVLCEIRDRTRSLFLHQKLLNGVCNSLRAMERLAAYERLCAAGKEPEEALTNDDITKADKLAVMRSYLDVTQIEAGLERVKKDEKKAIEKLVKKLPIRYWVTNTRGIGFDGVGIMLGIAGDPSNYSSYRKMVKFLGIAPRPAYYSPEHGKNLVPVHRRSNVLYWVGQGANAGNNYGDIYDKEKIASAERHPEWETDPKPTWEKNNFTPAHRYALLRSRQAMVRDLWFAWRAIVVNGMDYREVLQLQGQKSWYEYHENRERLLGNVR